ncbi:MAG TPA: DNA/RNA non-specific endonuclease [Thermoanaerobaculia bacterium]|jgi:endonuclease G
MNVKRLAVSCAFLTLALAGCTASHPPASRLARFTHFTGREAGFTQQEQAWVDDNCPLGLPQKDPSWQHGPTVYVAREGYVLEHSSVDKIALWVCERLVPEEVTGSAVRRDRFAPDPKLQGQPRSELQDYKRSGYDRGHQAPAGDQNRSQQLKDETFFLSNMAPQKGALNQKVWAEIEHKVRGWVEAGLVPTAWIITGGFFYDPAEEDEDSADGLILFNQIGPGLVSVPTHFYKIVVTKDGENWRAVAFVLENRGYSQPYRFEEYLEPVDWIEERTGLDFLPDLDPLAEPEVEGRVGTLLD